MAEQTQKTDKKTKLNVQYLRDKDREPVKGIFRYHECPGGAVSFSYRAYKGDNIERYDMTDGQIYTVPLGVARHLNKNCWYPEYEFFKNEETQNIQRVAKKVRRMSFQSLEFMDIDDITPTGNSIVTVEAM